MCSRPLEGIYLVVALTPGSSNRQNSHIHLLVLHNLNVTRHSGLPPTGLFDQSNTSWLSAGCGIPGLSSTCHRMISLLPFSANWYPPDALPTSLSYLKTEDFRVEVETQQRWDVRYGLQGWITGIRDHTNYKVSVTTGCQCELRQQSVVTDCKQSLCLQAQCTYCFLIK